MSVERPHEDRLGTGGATATEVLTRSGTGVASWEEPTGGSSVALDPEVPAGTIDGANDTFTLATTPTGDILLFKNGLLQRVGAGNDYTLAGNTITYEAGNIPQTGDSHIAYLAAAAAGGGTTLDLFGDGQDGDVVINSAAFSLSVGGSALITTNILLRDAYFHDLELNGGNLNVFGFKLFISGTLTMTSGVIHNNGIAPVSNGTNGSAGAGGSAGPAGAATQVGTTAVSAVGQSGGAGGFNAAGASPSAAGANAVGRTQMPAGAAGGASGQGQAGGQRAATTTVNTVSDRSVWTDMIRAISFRNHVNTAPTVFQFLGQAIAGGGGGGAAASGGGGGGGSGSSGGPLVIVANTVTGTTNLESKGGNGANGGNGGGTNAGGGAGGGGGPGGWGVLIYRDKTGWSGTFDVAGGTGGTGGTGIGTGAAGGTGPNGNAGFVKEWAV